MVEYTSSGTIQVNGKQEAFVSLHQFYCNLFYFETEDSSASRFRLACAG